MRRFQFATMSGDEDAAASSGGDAASSCMAPVPLPNDLKLNATSFGETPGYPDPFEGDATTTPPSPAPARFRFGAEILGKTDNVPCTDGKWIQLWRCKLIPYLLHALSVSVKGHLLERDGRIRKVTTVRDACQIPWLVFASGGEN